MTDYVICQKANRAKLTKREIDVLRLMVDGKTNNEIAELLNVTHHTAKAHVSSIIHKFKVKTRLEAAMFAYRNGYIVTANHRQD